MENNFGTYQKSITMIATDTFEITPSDSTDLDYVIRAFVTDGTGDVEVITIDGNTRIIPSSIIVAELPFMVQCTRVKATNTTASVIWGLV